MAAPLGIGSNVEQRAVLKLLSNEGVSPSEIYRGMKAQYGDSCLNENKTFKKPTVLRKEGPYSENVRESSRPKAKETVDTFFRAVRRVTV